MCSFVYIIMKKKNIFAFYLVKNVVFSRCHVLFIVKILLKTTSKSIGLIFNTMFLKIKNMCAKYVFWQISKK